MNLTLQLKGKDCQIELKKQQPYAVYKKHTLNTESTGWLKIIEKKENTSCNNKHEKAGVAVFIPDELDLKI